MLRLLVQGPVENIVVVTTGRDQIPDAGGDSEESKWLGGLTGQGLGNSLRYKGTKLSALVILENAATKKPPIILNPTNKIPWHTKAGKKLNEHIHKLKKPKKDRGEELVRLIDQEEDDDKVKELKAENTEVEETWTRLEKERNRLGDPINLEQAKQDNEALGGVIKEKRDVATKDWKAAYDSILKEKNDKVVRFLRSVDFKSGTRLK